MKTRAHSCSLLLLALCGCSDDGGLPFDVRQQEHDSGQQQQLDPPVLDYGLIPDRTCHDEVPIAGRAMPGVTVFALGGAAVAGVAGDAHPQSGRFCLPVQLKPQQQNTIEVRAQHPELGLSDPVMVQVLQEDCGGGGDDVPPGPGEESRNVALDMTVTSMDDPEEGNVTLLTDGDTESWARWRGGYHWYNPFADYDGWIQVSLEKVTKLQKIVVKWRDAEGAGTEYGTAYQVLISALEDPGDPDLENGYWEVVGTVTEGDGWTDIFDLAATQPLARHVALWLEQDGLGSWSEPLDTAEFFAIAEIEVWDAPDTGGPPPPPPDICAGY